MDNYLLGKYSFTPLLYTDYKKLWNPTINTFNSYDKFWEDKVGQVKNNTYNVHWTNKGGVDTFELFIPGYSKDEVQVNVTGKVISIKWGKEHEEGCYSFAVTDKYEIPEEVEVKDGILRMDFKEKKEPEVDTRTLRIV